MQLEKLRDLNVVALNDHRKGYEIFSNVYLVLGLEGKLKMLPGDFEGSMQCLNKAIEMLTLQIVSFESILAVDLRVNPNKVHGNNYMFRGAIRIDRYDFKGAAEDFQKADHYYPNHAKNLQWLGCARSGLEQQQEALEALNRAIALYPTTEEGIAFARDNYADAFAIRGHVKLLLQDLGGAKLDIDFACALDPHCMGVRSFRPIIYRSLGLLTD